MKKTGVLATAVEKKGQYQKNGRTDIKLFFPHPSFFLLLLSCIQSNGCRLFIPFFSGLEEEKSRGSSAFYYIHLLPIPNRTRSHACCVRGWLVFKDSTFVKRARQKFSFYNIGLSQFFPIFFSPLDARLLLALFVDWSSCWWFWVVFTSVYRVALLGFQCSRTHIYVPMCMYYSHWVYNPTAVIVARM